MNPLDYGAPLPIQGVGESMRGRHSLSIISIMLVTINNQKWGNCFAT